MSDLVVSANVDTLMGAATFAAFRASLGLDTGDSPTFTGLTLTGGPTIAGASIRGVNAMGALAIDVTKGINTKSVSADSTFTFSGTPGASNTWFSILITNGGGTARVMTIPSSFSVAQGAAITTTTLAANGKL